MMCTDRSVLDVDRQVCSQMDIMLLGELKSSSNSLFSFNDFWPHSAYHEGERRGPLAFTSTRSAAGEVEETGADSPAHPHGGSAALVPLADAGAGGGRKKRGVRRAAE